VRFAITPGPCRSDSSVFHFVVNRDAPTAHDLTLASRWWAGGMRFAFSKDSNARVIARLETSLSTLTFKDTLTTTLQLNKYNTFSST
jgi:hypothetical protein